MTQQTPTKEQVEIKPEEEIKVCGVVMPISACDSCSEHHWAEVKSIIYEAIGTAGFKPNLVSDANEIGVIQARIVQNLYDNPIVICDVSGKNANVMFELGMRLAFDKPTIIIKDDKTDYSFDTGVIEHLGYPRDLRFRSIVDFKEKLVIKIKAMEKATSEHPDHSVFLTHFGKFKVARIDEREVSREDYILAQVEDIKRLFLSKFSQLEDTYGRHASAIEGRDIDRFSERAMQITLITKEFAAKEIAVRKEKGTEINKNVLFKSVADRLYNEFGDDFVRYVSPLRLESIINDAIGMYF